MKKSELRKLIAEYKEIKKITKQQIKRKIKRS